MQADTDEQFSLTAEQIPKFGWQDEYIWFRSSSISAVSISNGAVIEGAHCSMLKLCSLINICLSHNWIVFLSLSACFIVSETLEYTLDSLHPPPMAAYYWSPWEQSVHNIRWGGLVFLCAFPPVLFSKAEYWSWNPISIFDFTHKWGFCRYFTTSWIVL